MVHLCIFHAVATIKYREFDEANKKHDAKGKQKTNGVKVLDMLDVTNRKKLDLFKMTASQN